MKYILLEFRAPAPVPVHEPFRVGFRDDASGTWAVMPDAGIEARIGAAHAIRGDLEEMIDDYRAKADAEAGRT